MRTERNADTFSEEPYSLGWRFDRCPIEGGDEDPCEGCPGWGAECGAIWSRREAAR